MIGGKIQPDADRRPERADRFELKRAHFDGEHVEVTLFARDFAERLADVAAGDRALAAGVQHLREQLRRGRLAVRAGDGDDRDAHERQPSSSSPIVSMFRDEKFVASGEIGSIPGLRTTRS